MTPAKEQLLNRLLACYPQGRSLTVPEKRVAASLVKDGLVEWVSGGGIQVYRVTEKANKQRELFRRIEAGEKF